MISKYKFIVFDLDDTLYDYNYSHKISLKKVLNVISKDFNLDLHGLENKYEEFSDNLKIQIGNTASSHSKFIYFHHLFRYFKIDIVYLNSYFFLYWNEFLKNLALYKNVYEFLNFLKDKSILYILTDYYSKETFQKLKQLKIIHFFKDIITSEEVGCDKPSQINFKYMYKVLKCKNKKSILFVGNDFKKDIEGAISFGLYSAFFLKNHQGIELNKNYIKFGDYSEILKYFKE
jgi:HAD superfamily hydrolase (TIGR01549 family)